MLSRLCGMLASENRPLRFTDVQMNMSRIPSAKGNGKKKPGHTWKYVRAAIVFILALDALRLA